MATGKPVIATAWGGPLDYLDERLRRAGCTRSAPEALVDGLADAMVSAAQFPDERLRMGRNGLEKARRLYDWDVKVDRMVDCYRRVMHTA